MVKRYIYLSLTLLIVLFLVSCGSEKITDQNGVTAKEFLKSKGYKIESYEGNTENYVLTKEKITKLPYMQNWGVQKEDPSKYLDKEVHVQKFTIKNHPFDHWESTSKNPENIVKSKGMTNVWVYVVDGQAVGGTSYPVIDELMLGGSYSLDGKTLEEVHHQNYRDWFDQWTEKYGNYHW